MGEIYNAGESVSYRSYTDGEIHIGNIEYFTEQGFTTVAVIRENESIVLISLGELTKETK